MNTSSCFQSKLDEVNKSLYEASQMKDFITTFKSCISDASYNALLDEIDRLNKELEETKGHQETYVPTIPIIFIAILYVILFSFIGMFYITSLTQSIGKIIDSDPTFLDYQDNYQEIIKCLNLNRFLLFIIVFIAIFVSNVYIIYTFIWKGKHIKQAMKIVSISITSVVGITFLLCNNPSFIKIFENTIGYAITKMFSPNRNYSFSEFMKKIFKHSIFPKGGINFDFMFTCFRLDNFNHILDDLRNNDNKYDFTIETNNNDLKDLFKMVVMKNTIGHLCWIYFSSIASTIICVKFLSKHL
jgi:hypothetical protein